MNDDNSWLIYCLLLYYTHPLTSYHCLTIHDRSYVGSYIFIYTKVKRTLILFNHRVLSYNILNIYQIVEYFVGIFVFKSLHEMMAGALSGFFQRNFNTRNSFMVNLVRSTYHKKKISQQSIRIAGPRIWNNLPILCKSSISLHSFKKLLKKYLQNLN